MWESHIFGATLVWFESLKLPIKRHFQINNPKSKVQNGMTWNPQV